MNFIMSDNDIKLLELIKNNTNRYKVVVGHDGVFVEDLYDENSLDYMGRFDELGCKLTHYLLECLGCNSEYVG